ncbi:hypothetical protein HID58_070958 [Brassica napus]|uniref:Uncharacterized protein n=1 Tax=Brassica napus TaxID=3708 RepID=A0ABQ7Z079_BRANA|nr:hypothetical protein HID58_070958 [Brassica napus]
MRLGVFGSEKMATTTPMDIEWSLMTRVSKKGTDGCGAGVLSLATGLQQPVWEDAVVLRPRLRYEEDKMRHNVQTPPRPEKCEYATEGSEAAWSGGSASETKEQINLASPHSC